MTNSIELLSSKSTQKDGDCATGVQANRSGEMDRTDAASPQPAHARTLPAPQCDLQTSRYICDAYHPFYVRFPPRLFNIHTLTSLLYSRPRQTPVLHLHNSGMPLLRLPNELLGCITEYLGSTGDINAFARSNRQLYRALNSYLYRRNIEESESSALIWAAQNNQLGTAQRLLEQHTNDQAKKICCVIPLCEAAGKGHEEIVRLLLDNGVNVDARRNKAAETAFTPTKKRTKAQTNQETRNWLASQDIDLDSASDDDDDNDNDDGHDDEWVATHTGNALYAASEAGHTNMVKLLLDYDADIFGNSSGRSGNAFQAAAEGGHEEIVKLLLESGFDVNTRGRYYIDDSSSFYCYGSNALCAASEKGNTALVKLLLEHDALVSFSGGIYGNPLQAAAAKGHEEIVEMLLNTEGIEINKTGKYLSWLGDVTDGAALYLASEEGHVNIVKLLLDRGADIDAKVDLWGTALTIAAVSNQEEVVRLLLERGADVNVENEFCSGALDAAAQYGHEEIAEMLYDAGADIEKALEDAEYRSGRNDNDYSLQILRNLVSAALDD
jgi:ankyrin repeat protein